ncbi:MAG: sulfatase [Thermodesulfobacteriota bacterium]
MTLIISMIILGICYFYYIEIIEILKATPITEFLGNFSNSKQDTYSIFITILILAVLYFLSLISYVFWHQPVGNILNKIENTLNSRNIKFAGLTLIAIMIFFNVSMFGYRHMNSHQGPNIVLITIDTLRADRLGSYGYKRDTSPNIDGLAKKGTLFEKAYSQSSWTHPSMASMHTSLYPTQLGIIEFETRLNDSVLTIAEHMKNDFYQTFAVVSNIAASQIFGFGQGFNQFERTYSLNPDVTTSKITTEKAIEYIEKNKNNKFFAWVHYMDPHGHYIDHEEFEYSAEYNGSLPSKIGTVYLNKNRDSIDNNDINYVKDLYDEEIAFTDKFIGKLIDSLNELGIEDNTIVILTADHGEEFMERTRFGHSETLYQEVIRVPLIIYNPLDPSKFGKTVSNNVEVRYIANTIADLTNSTATSLGGYNLLDIEKDKIFNGVVYSELNASDTAIYINDWKLIANPEKDTFELYNLKKDPLEQTNKFSSEDDDITEVKKILQANLSEHNSLEKLEATKINIKQEDIKQLKALGYLQ